MEMVFVTVEKGKKMKGNCGECNDRWFCEIDPDECDAWPDPVPMTNADRIRAMSDEDMAKCIFEIGFDCHLCSEHERISDNPFLRHEKCDEKCTEHCLEWLQQPAEEVADDAD